ncbi:MAG: TRAP transporter small permease subunit [Lautropia sp.]|nr:TRAP transporter small permease subunit [Lautropia sp.]
MNKIIYGLSRALSWLGCWFLLLIGLISVVSITGRALSGFGLGPVNGDFELVEIGTAVAVFCFMPWAHLTRSHAVVDLFWQAYPKGMQRALSLLSDVLMLLLWIVLVWRMGVAMMDYRANEEVSFILQVPVWWGYALSMGPALFGCVVYAWRILEDLGVANPPEGFVACEGGMH